MTEQSKQYAITTLGDIYALPDSDTIDRCMKELSTVLVQSKLLSGLMGEAINATSGNSKRREAFVLDFPLIWTDDEKGEIDIKANGPDGNEILRMEIRRKADD